MKRVDLERGLHSLWYADSWIYRLLLPLSWLYCGLGVVRRLAYRIGLLRGTALDCPVVVVGNLVAGGSGKTPLVIALADYLRQAGLRVGLLCRGYRGRAKRWPQRVTPDSDPDEVGDEAVLLAQKTGLPVMAGPKRVLSGRALLEQAPCDVVLCDDGLQHYALKRDLEIVAIDPEYAFGNGACLPAGPLREPRSRLQQVDAVVSLGEPCREAGALMQLAVAEAFRLVDPRQRCKLSAFAGQSVHAIAGIAHPQRFFRRLREAGMSVEAHAFEDHHRYMPEDIAFDDPRPVLMTEKDAVKCQAFSRSDWWVVPLEVQLDATFGDWLVNAVSKRE